MADIVLATLNAKFSHTAFGLRYLLANLGELRPRAELVEFDIQQRPVDVVERILALNPQIVGLGVYIWNVGLTTEIVGLLKRLRPGITVVLGGPEVSYETGTQPVVALADCTITGEADLEFPALCRRMLAGESPGPKVVVAPLPNLNRMELPYGEYGDRDLQARVVYVEASRGCPFRCEFCLSSLDIPVRAFPLARFLAAMQGLIDRGARRFKFVDRTFNLDLRSGRAILDFFRERVGPDWLLHFELVPDRLPSELRDAIVGFPAGTLQFEVGIQTLDEIVAQRIQRRQDLQKAEENLRFLRRDTGAHVHADLIVGLPGEGLPGFAAGFDRLLGWGPHEIQVGLLKRLRGTTIGRHDAEWGMVYSPVAPYELLENRLLDFATMQRLRRFARYWDLVANSGNFRETLPLLWAGGESPFDAFLTFSDWLAIEVGRQHAVALPRLARCLHRYLTTVAGRDDGKVRTTVLRDYERGGRRSDLRLGEADGDGAIEGGGTGVAGGRRDRRGGGRRRQDRHGEAAGYR